MKRAVLIVEDDDDFSQMLGAVMTKRGLPYTRIVEAKQITEAITKEEPALILMDNHLADGLGVTFVSTIKKLSPMSVVVLITADDKHVLKQFPGFDEIDGFISKPVSMRDLDLYLNLPSLRPT